MPTLLSDSIARTPAKKYSIVLYSCGIACTMLTEHQPEYACLITGHTPDVEQDMSSPV